MSSTLAADAASSQGHKYVIEHMEEDDDQSKTVPPWVHLEYAHMLQVIAPSPNSHIHFTSLSSTSTSRLPSILSPTPSTTTSQFTCTTSPILSLLSTPTPSIPLSKICLLDPKAPLPLSPSDGDEGKFEYFLFGGILGDDPPRDRTGELRKLGFEGRHLGVKQMTTDTALHVTKLVVEDKIPLDEIPYNDYPTISFSSHESVEMPFRYVKLENGEPSLPDGMRELLKEDLNKSFEF